MHPNAELITRFYRAFRERDGAAMAACYHRDIHFSDAVFPGLHGPRAGAMWRMLCARAVDLKIEFRDVEADDRSGRAHWEAWYTFTVTGRAVHNVVDARFEFRNGLIARHEDVFAFWRWTRQALGPVGWLLGWSPLVRDGVRKKASTGLDDFMEKERRSGDDS